MEESASKASLQASESTYGFSDSANDADGDSAAREKLGYEEKYSIVKKKGSEISWVMVGLNLLRESSKYLNLLFDSSGTGFCFRRV